MGHCCAAQLVLTWSRKSSVCSVLLLSLLTWKPGWDQAVVDPVFQHSRRHNVVFVRELVKAGSVGFVERCCRTRWSFFRCQKGWSSERFIVDVRASNRHFLRLPSGPLFTGEGLWYVEFQGMLEDPQNWFVGSADINNAFHQMRIPGLLEALFAVPCSRIRSWSHRKFDRTVTSCSRFFDISCPYNTSDRFLLGDVFLSRCHGPLHGRGER